MADSAKTPPDPKDAPDAQPEGTEAAPDAPETPSNATDGAPPADDSRLPMSDLDDFSGPAGIPAQETGAESMPNSSAPALRYGDPDDPEFVAKRQIRERLGS